MWFLVLNGCMDKKVTDEIVRSSYEVATLLFLMDKGIFIHTIVFPPQVFVPSFLLPYVMQ